jgi:hypothetical protein
MAYYIFRNLVKQKFIIRNDIHKSHGKSLRCLATASRMAGEPLL